MKWCFHTCAGDIKRPNSSGDLILGPVLIRVGKIRHLLEGNNFDAKLTPVFLNSILGIIRTVEFNTFRVASGASMVTSNNEVCSTVILANDSVPDSLTRSTHTHSKGKKAKNGHSIGVSRKQSLVDADTGEVIDVSRFSEADNWMDQDISLASAGSANCELSVGTMHGVPMRC